MLARGLQKYHAKLCKTLSKLLTKSSFIEPYCFDKKHFSRNRKLPFQTVTLIILQLLKSSIKSELKSFYTTIFKVDQVVNWVSDGSFCKARQKIRHHLFIDLYKYIVRQIYTQTGVKRWFHFRLLAVDGSELNLPSSKELLTKYGHHHTNSIGTKIPQARTSFLVDVLNNITIDAQIESFRTSEQQMLMPQLECIGKGDLLTADCNYGHFWILKKILGRKAGFCIRMSHVSHFVKDFLASGEKDIVMDWIPSPKTKENCIKHNIDRKPIKVRLVRIELPCGNTEVLVTSLCNQDKYIFKDIMDLYGLRWGAEEEIKKYMQRLLVEFFSSIKQNGILQDFYANVFMLNLVSLLAMPIKDEIHASSCHCKYLQQINWSSAINDVRKRLALLFLRSVNKISLIIESIWKSFKINTEAIKPGRKFPRDKRKKGSRKKAFIQYKPAF